MFTFFPARLPLNRETSLGPVLSAAGGVTGRRSAAAAMRQGHLRHVQEEGQANGYGAAPAIADAGGAHEVSMRQHACMHGDLAVQMNAVLLEWTMHLSCPGSSF